VPVGIEPPDEGAEINDTDADADDDVAAVGEIPDDTEKVQKLASKRKAPAAAKKPAGRAPAKPAAARKPATRKPATRKPSGAASADSAAEEE
jgi:hypothetical protein